MRAKPGECEHAAGESRRRSTSMFLCMERSGSLSELSCDVVKCCAALEQAAERRSVALLNALLSTAQLAAPALDNAGATALFHCTKSIILQFVADEEFVMGLALPRLRALARALALHPGVPAAECRDSAAEVARAALTALRCQGRPRQPSSGAISRSDDTTGVCSNECKRNGQPQSSSTGGETDGLTDVDGAIEFASVDAALSYAADVCSAVAAALGLPAARWQCGSFAMPDKDKWDVVGQLLLEASLVAGARASTACVEAAKLLCEPSAMRPVLEALASRGDARMRACALDTSAFIARTTLRPRVDADFVSGWIAMAIRGADDDDPRVRKSAVDLAWHVADRFPNAAVPAQLSSTGATISLANEAFVMLSLLMCCAQPSVREAAAKRLGTVDGADEKVLLQGLSKKPLSESSVGADKSLADLAKLPVDLARSGSLISLRQQGSASLTSQSEMHLADATKLRNSVAHGAFVHGVEDDLPGVRAATVTSVGSAAQRSRRFARAAVPLLFDVLADDSSEVRELTLCTLSSIVQRIDGDHDEEPVFATSDQLESASHLLSDKCARVRESACRFLGVLKADSADQALEIIKILRAHAGSRPEERLAVFAAMRETGLRNASHFDAVIPAIAGNDAEKPFLVYTRPQQNESGYLATLIAIANAIDQRPELLLHMPSFAAADIQYVSRRFAAYVPQKGEDTRVTSSDHSLGGTLAITGDVVSSARALALAAHRLPRAAGETAKRIAAAAVALHRAKDALGDDPLDPNVLCRHGKQLLAASRWLGLRCLGAPASFHLAAHESIVTGLAILLLSAHAEEGVDTSASSCGAWEILLEAATHMNFAASYVGKKSSLSGLLASVQDRSIQGVVDFVKNAELMSFPRDSIGRLDIARANVFVQHKTRSPSETPSIVYAAECPVAVPIVARLTGLSVSHAVAVKVGFPGGAERVFPLSQQRASVVGPDTVEVSKTILLSVKDMTESCQIRLSLVLLTSYAGTESISPSASVELIPRASRRVKRSRLSTD